MDQLSPLGGLLKNKKSKDHGNTIEYRIRFHRVMGIPIQKIESSKQLGRFWRLDAVTNS